MRAGKPIIATDLADQEIAGIMGCPLEEVESIRMLYVSGDFRVVAIGKRIAQEL